MSLENPGPSDDFVIDLAHEADFRLGSLMVSPSSREVSREGVREALEPRVMQVLVALYRAEGGVVSRDDLITRCWEGRVVGEDAINRAIWRLRKLSEADDGASFTIDTIARVGYRLVAAASRDVPPPVDSATGTPPSSTQLQDTPEAPARVPHRRWLVTAALILAGLAGATAAWLLWPERHWTVESSRPFLSTLALEGYPDFSSDGRTLAYSSGPEGGPRKIYVRNIAGGEGIKVTGDPYDDISPTWSSDGARLAYVAIKPGEPCHIMVTTVPAGDAHEAGRCQSAEGTDIAWQPGTSILYYAERAGLKGDTISRLDLDSGARQTVVETSQLRDTMKSLRCSPDGKWLVYVLAGQHIMLRDLRNGGEKRLGGIPGGTDSLAWSADSAAVLAEAEHGNGTKIVAFPLNGTPPYQIYATTTNIGRIAAGGGLLATETDISRFNLARVTATPQAVPDIADSASANTWSPSFAPDGTLAFLSNRSGGNAAWLMKPGATPVLLFDSGLVPLWSLRFSPDGSRLVLVRNLGDSAGNKFVRILTPAGATLSTYKLPSVGLGMPSWSPDGKDLIVFDRRLRRTVRFPADSPAKASPFAAPHWVGIAIRKEGVLATRADKPGIWRIDGAPRQINGEYPRYYDPPLAFKDSDVLVPDFSGVVPRLLAQPVNGGRTRVIGYVPGDAKGFQSAFAVNPRNGEILYRAMIGRDTNIDLLTLERR